MDIKEITENIKPFLNKILWHYEVELEYDEDAILEIINYILSVKDQIEDGKT